jgi:hypothetical protein
MTYPVRSGPSWRLAALLAALALSATAAMADVVPRTSTLYFMSGAWDLEDQFCAGKQDKDRCEIPGTPFEGGGPGICKRDVPYRATKIELTCALDRRPLMFGGNPEGPYLADSATCELVARGEFSLPRELTCTPSAPPADRFCATLREGDACTAEGVMGGLVSYPGRCARVKQEHRYHFRSQRVATREVLQCNPAKLAPARVLAPRARPTGRQGDPSQ